MKLHDWNTPTLLAAPVYAALSTLPAEYILGITKNPDALADTDAWAEAYGISLHTTANVVVVETRKTRNADKKFAAILVLADTRADLNGVVKKALDVSKVSFAPSEKAVEATGMQSGGMSPIGLPAEWPLLVDARVTKQQKLYIGSGIRPSKLVVNGALFSHLAGATVLEGLAQ